MGTPVTEKCNNKAFNAFSCTAFKNFKHLWSYHSNIGVGWWESEVCWGLKDLDVDEQHQKQNKINWWELEVGYINGEINGVVRDDSGI